jgi:SOS response regulatory protein OraA/RecX
LEEETFPFDADCIKAEKIALRLIARAEQSSSGLAVKLGKRGIDPSIASQVISGLLDKKLLDDQRFAECWIRAHLRGKKTPSPLWFLVSLEKRGIKREISLSAIDKILDEETEFILLLKYIEKVDIQFKENTGFLKTKLRHERFSSQVIDRFFDSVQHF